MSVASKLWVHEPDTFFFGADEEISEKQNFFVIRSIPKNFQQGNFLGQLPMESLRTQNSEKTFEIYFDPVLVSRNQVSEIKCGPLAKIIGV